MTSLNEDGFYTNVMKPYLTEKPKAEAPTKGICAALNRDGRFCESTDLTEVSKRQFCTRHFIEKEAYSYSCFHGCGQGEMLCCRCSGKPTVQECDECNVLRLTNIATFRTRD